MQQQRRRHNQHKRQRCWSPVTIYPETFQAQNSHPTPSGLVSVSSMAGHTQSPDGSVPGSDAAGPMVVHPALTREELVAQQRGEIALRATLSPEDESMVADQVDATDPNDLTPDVAMQEGSATQSIEAAASAAPLPPPEQSPVGDAPAPLALTEADVAEATRKALREYAMARGKLIRLIENEQYPSPDEGPSEPGDEDDIDIMDDDANLPRDAEHPMDPRQLADPILPNQWTPTEMQNYISNYCQKLSMMGVNLWAIPGPGSSWPEPWDSDYRKGPGIYADFWAVDPGEVNNGLTISIAARYRKAALLFHPDKHADVPQKVIDEMTGLFRAMTDARDGFIGWLKRLEKGEVQSPGKKKGCTF